MGKDKDKNDSNRVAYILQVGKMIDDIIPLYHSDIFCKKNVGTIEQREDLKKQILLTKEKDDSPVDGSNQGCWRSTATYQMDWLYGAMRDLVKDANNVYFEKDPVFKHFLSQCSNLDFNIWTNVNDKGAKNSLHTHTPDAWAGIYYVQAEGTGNLLFYNPANVLQQCEPKSPFIKKMGIPPKDGMLILWPGWVPHEVEENTSDKQRINLAWGINFN